MQHIIPKSGMLPTLYSATRVKALSLLVLVIAISIRLTAQDNTFTLGQSYPTRAPSFAGIEEGTRISFQHRSFYPSLVGSPEANAVAVEHYFPDMHNGIALMYFQHTEGYGLRHKQGAVLYNYRVQLNTQWNLSAGVQFYFTQHSLDFESLTFSDQISLNGVSPASIESYTLPSLVRFDAASSVLVYSSKLWFAARLGHLMRSNVSLTGDLARMPLSLTVSGGYKHLLQGSGKEEKSLHIALQHTVISHMQQSEAKLIFVYKQVNFGTGARTSYSVYGNSAIQLTEWMFMTGIKVKSLNLGYAFDVSTFWQSGSHEVLVAYAFKSKNKNQTPED